MTHLLLSTSITEVFFSYHQLPSPLPSCLRKENTGPSVLEKHFITLNSANVCLKKKKKSFPTLANILSIVKHFSVKVSAVCLEKWLYQEWRYEQLLHSGSFPSFSSCKFSLSGMLMGNVILFLFAAVLLF